MRTRTWRWLAAGLVVAAATTACNGGGDPSAETTSSAPPTTTEPTTAPPPTVSDVGRRLLEDPDFAIFAPGLEQNPVSLEVLRSYVRAEQAWIKAGMAPVDPDHPELSATTTGAALAKRQEAVRELRERAQAYQAPKMLRVTFKSFDLTGATASLLVCFTLEVPIYDVSSGRVVDDDLFSQDNRVTMELADGHWRLARLGAVGEARDGESCAS